MLRVLPGSGACVALAGGLCCREYSSADGRLGPGKGGGWGRLLTVTGACAEGGRLELVDPRVGSDKPCAPEDEDESAIVSRPTSVLNQMVVSRLSDDTTGPRAYEMLLEDIFDTN